MTVPSEWKPRPEYTVLAATGHRPDKLGGYGPEVQSRLQTLARTFLERRVEREPRIQIISGMALGWDTAWAEAAVSLKLPLVAALPFIGQDQLWPSGSQKTFRRLLSSAELVVVSSGGYAAWKMQARNRWMIDHCNQLIALWDGSPGGTGNCMAYAQKQGMNITNLWPKFQRLCTK